jgi:hypothetical protein
MDNRHFSYITKLIKNKISDLNTQRLCSLFFFWGKFSRKGNLKCENVKMKWLLGFSISKKICIWVLNQKVSQKYRRVFKCFLTSISCSEPNLAKSSYGWLSLLAMSQNWPKIKHFSYVENKPLCCLFQWPRKGAFSVLEWICWVCHTRTGIGTETMYFCYIVI